MAAGEYELALDAYTRAAGQQGLNVDTLSALDTDGVEPLTNLSDTVNVLREDEPGETLGVEEALSNAAETAGGCFCVPKTVE